MYLMIFATAIYITPATIVTCIAVGLALAAAIMFGIRSKLKSVHAARGAGNYTRAGSFKVTDRRDTFMFRNLSKRPIPKKQ